MSSWRQFLQRLITAFRHERAEDELAREVQSHLALLEKKFLRDGLTPEDARLAARRAFGGVEQAKELQRDARSFRWIDDARRDAGYAVRSLTKSPAFTIAAVLTLAIGIGATTAIYSVVDRVLLQPLPFPDAHQLVRIRHNQPTRDTPSISYQEFLEWRSRTKLLSGMAAATLNPQGLIRTRAGTVRFTGGTVSSNYFEVLGVEALLGRTITPSDEANPDVVVLSHDMWTRYFDADPSVIGSPIEFRSGSQAGRLFTVLGVMPEGMEQLGTPLDYYVPIAIAPNHRAQSGIGQPIGRLRDGVSLAAAAEEADAIARTLLSPRPASAPPLTGPRVLMEPLKDNLVATLQPALRVFLTAVAVVLLIVCANVANLLLARGTARRREMAVRLALGAGRSRIVRQVLTECLVLASIGGVLGAMIGAAGVALVKELATVPADGIFRLVFRETILPRANEVTVDLRMLATALALALATSLLFGLLPALHLSRTNHLLAMGSRGSGKGRRDTHARTVLVVGQLVMATVLLVGAGLLARSFINLSRVEKGYDPSHALAFQLVLPTEYSTARKSETIGTLLSHLRQTPGIEAAGFAYAGILIGVEDTVGTWVPPGLTLAELESETSKPRLKSVSHGYFEAMGVRLLDGRSLEAGDNGTAAPVAVVNRSVATRLFGEGSPVGSTLAWHSGGATAPIQVEIVGVVEDVRQGPVSRPPYSEIFMDYRQVIAAQQRRGAPPALIERLAFGFLSFGIRTTGDPAAAIPLVRQAVMTVDSNAGIDAIVPMEQLVSNSVAQQRFYAVMLSAFAGVAGLLAVIGIYGVLAYAVIQRTQEIGIRMALGARRSQVLGLVLSRGLLLAAIGVSLGLFGATAAARYLQGMLFGIEPLDLSTFAGVGIAFALVAGLASYLPARRATQVDPMVALRVD
ncbi:MAG: ADOP family duplicated permease [Vicinamibacterales bacterium]